MFEKHFNNIVPTALAKWLFKTKDKNKNIKFVNVIKSALRDLKNEIEKMPKEEKKTEKPNEIVNTVKEKKQSGGGLKILTPIQMLSRLPITLA